jgi:hypothetical protein
VTRSEYPLYEPLDTKGCHLLAEALGDTSETIISCQLLRRGLCNAYVAGDPSSFAGAIVQARDFPSEPTGYGQDATVIWDLLQSAAGWECVLVALENAAALGDLVESQLATSVRYLDDVCLEMTGACPAFRNDAVRLLTRRDLNVLQAAPPELRMSCYRDVRELLSEGTVACATVSGQVVASALTAARSERFAEVGVYTSTAFRGRGYSTAAAALVCERVQNEGQTPVWSAGAHNAASLRVAEKLGFVEVSRRRYVIMEPREPQATGR